MTEYYNNYLNKITTCDNYSAEISFVNTNKTILSIELAFVEYIEDNKWKNGIFKMTDELKKIYVEYKKNSSYINNRIKEIQYTKSNYSYIEIIRDDVNPQLEGKILIFKYGNKIANIIGDYIRDNQYDRIYDTFKLNVNRKQQYINFDSCHFTVNEYLNEDYSLDISSDINIKTLNVSNIERKEKLKKLRQL